MILAVGALLFFVLLVTIIRSGAGGDDQKSKKRVQAAQKPKSKKQKKNSKKQKEDLTMPDEWDVDDYDREKERKEVMEFLKGRDPAENSKGSSVGLKSARSKKKKEAASSDDSGVEHVPEGFEVVSDRKKKPVDSKKSSKKKKNKNEVEESKNVEKKKNPETFYKPAPGSKEALELEKQKEKRKRRGPKSESDSAEPVERRRNQPVETGEAEQPREKKPRESSGSEDKPRREKKEPRPPKPRPVTSPPNVKYEEADLSDILNSITKDYRARRKPTGFSSIPRTIVISILAKLECRDLVVLSEINHFFMNAARKDSLWKDLLSKDFGLRETGKSRTWRAAYKTEYLRKRNVNSAPSGDDKDKATQIPQPKKDNSKKNTKKEAIAEQTAE